MDGTLVGKGFVRDRVTRILTHGENHKWIQEKVENTLKGHLERLENVKRGSSILRDVYTDIQNRKQAVKRGVRRDTQVHAQRVMEERDVKELFKILKSQEISLSLKMQQAAHDLALLDVVSQILNTGLLKGFSLANSLMDRISEQATVSEMLKKDLSRINNDLFERQKDLVTVEEDRAMAKTMEQSTKGQLFILKRCVAEQRSTKRAAEHVAMISQAQVHRMHDEIVDISAKLDAGIMDIALHAQTATTVAEGLHSVLVSLTHAISLAQNKIQPPQYSVQDKRVSEYARALVNKCHMISYLRSIPALEFVEGSPNASPEHIRLMEQSIKLLNKYSILHARRKSLRVIHDQLLAQEKVLLVELETAKSCLATKHREICQKMLQEDLISIEAKQKAKKIFNNIQDSSRAMLHVTKAGIKQTQLREEEASLRQYKVHLMRALRELRHTNTKLKIHREKMETSARVRNQKLNVALHNDTNNCQSQVKHARDMESKLMETSMRQLTYQTIVDIISKKPQLVSQ